MSATKQRTPPVRKRRVPRRGFKLRADGRIRAEDHFCGAGGTTTGVLSVEGWMVVHAANHDPTSILTHSTNYPMVEHSCADIPTMNPAGCPEADVLFTSPECKARSYAVGKQKDDPSLFDPKGDKTAERSRATMDEVTRFAAELQYLYVRRRERPSADLVVRAVGNRPLAPDRERQGGQVQLRRHRTAGGCATWRTSATAATGRCF